MIRVFTILVVLAVGLSGSSVMAAVDADPDAFGNHIRVHFRNANGAQETPILEGVTPNGDVAFSVIAIDRKLYATDGADDGVPRPLIQVGPTTHGSSTHWVRLDVVVHEDTYTVYRDQFESVTARTFVPSAQVAPVGPVDSVEWARLRVDDDAMRMDEDFTFHAPMWERVPGDGTITQLQGAGYLGGGRIQLASAQAGFAVAQSSTYLRAPVAGYDGTYGMESVALLDNGITPPFGFSVAAGLRGTAEAPEVQWAIVFDTVVEHPGGTAIQGIGMDWAFFLIDAAGTRTQVSDEIGLRWHPVDLLVDEPAGLITITLDDKTTTFAADLGASTHVGAGHILEDAVSIGRDIVTLDGLAVFDR